MACRMRICGGMTLGGMNMGMGVMDDGGYEGYWSCLWVIHLHGSVLNADCLLFHFSLEVSWSIL